MRAYKVLSLAISAAFLSGCASTSITNLTPRSHTRNSEHVYPVEIDFNTNLRAVRRESIRPYVQIGDDNYLMRKTSIVEDRWESLIPVTEQTELVNYRIKVDFNYNAISEPAANSVLSQPYQLRIID